MTGIGDGRVEALGAVKGLLRAVKGLEVVD
jgi:hypothetical protein